MQARKEILKHINNPKALFELAQLSTMQSMNIGKTKLNDKMDALEQAIRSDYDNKG